MSTSEDDPGLRARLRAIEAAVSSLSVGVLGYELTENPQGFVLAVLLDAVVGWAQDLANEIAAKIADMGSLLVLTIVDGLGSAFGAPGRVMGDLLLDGVEGWNDLLVSIAGSMGPFAFLVIPVGWVIGLLVVVAIPVAGWRAYKWVRTVIL